MKDKLELKFGTNRKQTSTSSFGTTLRESHDSSRFYERFTSPEIQEDTDITRIESSLENRIFKGDARDMSLVPSNSVALVVTSPPYFVGKEYEIELGKGGTPKSYFEYLEMLSDVFVESKRVLEPGGKIAVNVANLGRKPYRSLSGDIISIFQDIGLLLRGEIIWWKGKAAGGSCTWGSFQSPSNPVLRDVTERVVVASKGRFDRAFNRQERLELNLPNKSSVTKEEFMQATTDVWEILPESAKAVGHPAPFPIALPQRLIELYTFRDDVILDPFMGSGTTALAAVMSSRRYIGFETDQSYIDLANSRIKKIRESTANRDKVMKVSENSSLCTSNEVPDCDGLKASESLRDALLNGESLNRVSKIVLDDAGFVDIELDYRMPGTNIKLTFVALDRVKKKWLFLVVGSFTLGVSGFSSRETLLSTIGQAAVISGVKSKKTEFTDCPLIVLTNVQLEKKSRGYRELNLVTGPNELILDVINVLNPNDRKRLSEYSRSSW